MSHSSEVSRTRFRIILVINTFSALKCPELLKQGSCSYPRGNFCRNIHRSNKRFPHSLRALMCFRLQDRHQISIISRSTAAEPKKLYTNSTKPNCPIRDIYTAAGYSRLRNTISIVCFQSFHPVGGATKKYDL